MTILFQPKQVLPMNEMSALDLILSEACAELAERRGFSAQDASAAGIMDLWRLFREGKIKEAMELWDAIQSRDIMLIEKELGDILILFGQPEYAPQVHDLAVAIKSGEWAAIGSEACDVLKLIFEEFRKKVGDTAFRITDTHIDDFSGVMARQWLADNRGPVRNSQENWFVSRRLRNVPEVLAMFKGELTVTELAAVNPERLALIIDICRAAIPLLALAGAFFPACTAASIALKFLVAWYDSNHPKSMAEGNAADKGLCPSDFFKKADPEPAVPAA